MANEKLDQEGSEEAAERVEDIVDDPPATEEEERSLVRKLDRRILPITCLLYLFACAFTLFYPNYSYAVTHGSNTAALDRSNLGNARLQGLPEDVLGGDKTGVLFDWLTSGFYFSYVSAFSPAFTAVVHNAGKMLILDL